MGNVTAIVLHHTVTAKDATRDDILAMHKARGFRDVGYHWLIRDAEQVEIIAGRPTDGDGSLDPWEYGAHSKGENSHTIGVSMMGNYSISPPSPNLWVNTVTWISKLCQQYNLPSSAVKGHREMPGAATECPGTFIDLDLLRAAVSEVLGETDANA